MNGSAVHCVAFPPSRHLFILVLYNFEPLILSHKFRRCTQLQNSPAYQTFYLNGILKLLDKDKRRQFRVLLRIVDCEMLWVVWIMSVHYDWSSPCYVREIKWQLDDARFTCVKLGFAINAHFYLNLLSGEIIPHFFHF